MGLLDKAVKTQGITEISEESLSKPGVSAVHEDAFLAKLLSYNKSVDFGSQIFNHLIKEFEVVKAVLLYRNEKKAYYNLCSSGYDITTNNRMRLDEEILGNTDFYEILRQGHPFLFNPDKISLEKYFSKREYGLIEEFFCVPFIADDELIALLIITEWKSFPPENWENIFESISKAVSLPLFKSRNALIKNSEQNSITPSQDIAEILVSIFSQNPQNDFYLIKMNLSELLKLLSVEKGLTISNMKSEIVSVFKTMSGRDSEILELPENSILLVQKKDKIPDIELFTHQLSSSLPMLYSNLKMSPDLKTQIMKYASNSDLKELLEDLI